MTTVALTRDHVRRIDNYDIDATGGGLWTDTTHYRVTAGSTQRLLIMGGLMNRSVNATAVATLYNGSGQPIHQFCSKTAGTGVTTWADSGGGLFIMDPADYFEILFGAAQDANAYASCVVMELQP